MKNLKRLLSLALAGTMLSGMMVMAASAADFTDADEIVNTEAVDTMVALNIINGKDTGAFDPEGLVTRAEMAKMIATAVNGGVAPTFGVKATPTYTDTKGHWAEQFIEYCSDMKYINGRGNGTFDPNGNVTGTEAAKMVLTALGYESRAYQLTGADWAINTNALAIRDCKPSLYENLNGVSMNLPITRDSAAQLIWNGVQNYIVEYNPNVTITGTDITYGYQKSTTTTLLKQAYDANISSGMFDGNSKVLSSLKDGQLQVTVDTNNGTAVDTPTAKTITADLDISYIGENVKIIWKDEKNTTKGLDAKDKIYGVFPTGETEVIHATVDDINANYTTTGEVKIDGTVYKCVAAANTSTVVVDKNYGAGSVNATAASAEGTAAAIRSIAAQAGSTIKVILNDDGKIEKVYLVESKLATVTAKTSEKITLSNMGTIKIADNDVYEDIAKNDVVVATVLYKTAATTDGAYTIVEKAEKVSGEVTGFTEDTSSTTSKIVVDGETYKVANKAAMPTNVGGETAESYIEKGDIGADFDLYLVNGYVAAAVKTTETANNYSLVMEVTGTSSSTSSAFERLKLYVMDGEGNKTVITVSDSSSKKAATDYGAGDLVTYTINDKGEAVVTLEKDYSAGTADAGVAATANTQYNKDTKSFGESDGAKAVTAGNAVLFAEVNSGVDFTATTGTKFKVYNIRDLNTFNVPSGNKYSVQKDSDGKIVAVVANLNGTPAGATVNVEIGMVVAADGVIKINGTAYNTYKVWNGTEELKVNIVKDATNGDTLAKGTIYSFIRTSDDTYADDDAFTPVKGSIAAVGATNALTLDGTAHTVVAWAIKEYNEADKLLTGYNTVTGNDTIGYTGGGVDTYAVDDDVKIIYVNANDDKAGDDIGVNAFDATTGKINAFVISKDGGKVKYIIIETSGKKNIWE